MPHRRALEVFPMISDTLLLLELPRVLLCPDPHLNLRSFLLSLNWLRPQSELLDHLLVLTSSFWQFPTFGSL